eukprot:6393698-Prymnesium_polylepis.1
MEAVSPTRPPSSRAVDGDAGRVDAHLVRRELHIGFAVQLYQRAPPEPKEEGEHRLRVSKGATPFRRFQTQIRLHLYTEDGSHRKLTGFELRAPPQV